MTSKPTSINLSDEDRKYLDSKGNGSDYIRQLLALDRAGKLVNADELNDKTLTELQKEKMATEIELNKLKQQAMEAKKVIDQAGALKVEMMALDKDFKKYRNEKIRRQLDGIPAGTQAPATATKTPSIMEFTIACPETNCGKSWDSLYFEDRSNPLLEMHHVVASHLNLVHGISSVPPDMSPFRMQQKIKEAMQGP